MFHRPITGRFNIRQVHRDRDFRGLLPAEATAGLRWTATSNTQKLFRGNCRLTKTEMLPEQNGLALSAISDFGLQPSASNPARTYGQSNACSANTFWQAFLIQVFRADTNEWA